MQIIIWNQETATVVGSATIDSGGGDKDRVAMPFLHEGSPAGTFATALSLADLKNVIGAATQPRSVQKILPRDPQRKPSSVSVMGTKMMGNGSPSSTALAVAAMNNFQSPGERDASYVASRRARSNNFTLKETFDLLKVWASPEMQWQMKHNFRNFRVWEAISYSMSELGHDRTAIQCKNRIQNLTSIFYRIKKSKQDYRSFNFPYFKLIGDVLEGKKQGSSLGSLGLHAPSVNAYGQGLNPADFQGSNDSPPQAPGFAAAAHMALVEEYQHLINGQPDAYALPPASSPQTNDHMSVLSPEVSLSEGNSPIRVENQGGSATGLRNGAHHIKEDEERIDDEEGASEFDEQMQDEDETSDPPDSVSRSRKRPYPQSFSRGFPPKRPRGHSGGSGDGSLGDPVSQYLAEMVEIERGWLEMERERAENERQMMMYMMQILQALVSPQGQGQEDESEAEESTPPPPQGKSKDENGRRGEDGAADLKEEDVQEEPAPKIEENGDTSD